MEGEEDAQEFRAFCLAQQNLRQNPTSATEHCDSDHGFEEEDLIQIFSVVMMLVVGVVVRQLLRRTGSSLPYTLILMVLGLGVGQLGRAFCPHLAPYTQIARTRPEILLFTFLPILIFQAAYSISPHILYRTATQILLVSVPGMLLTTFATGSVCLFLFRDYGWSFAEASLFGCMVSGTDAVSVVALLRHLGAPQSLSVLMEGESLFNDGITILLFEILSEVVRVGWSEGGVVLRLPLKSLQIGVGGPVFGFLMGKFTILFLSFVYNDPTVEISITLSSAYLTYYLGEAVFGVSGVIGVVGLGITLRNEPTSISPSTEKGLEEFWEMLRYLANTILFALIGLIMGERSLGQVGWRDFIYLLLLYIIINIIRLLMVVLLSPIMSRLGYGFGWKEVLIMSWGGLRGAFALALALHLFDDPHFCHNPNLAPKMLFHVSGLVFLTLVVNGTTTRGLMGLLGMGEVSGARRAEMEIAIRIAHASADRATAALRNDPFLADSDWARIAQLARIHNPYPHQGDGDSGVFGRRLAGEPGRRILAQLLLQGQEKRSGCPVCSSHPTNQKQPMTMDQFHKFAQEARLRVIKALKISFCRQYEQGVLRGDGLKILIRICEEAEDDPFKMVGSQDLVKYWTPAPNFGFLSRSGSIRPLNHTPTTNTPTLKGESVIEGGGRGGKVYGRYLVAQSWFWRTVDLVLVLSLVSTLLQVLLPPTQWLEWRPFVIALSFQLFLLLLVEAVLKLRLFGLQAYLKDRWNYLHIAVLALSVGDIVLILLPPHSIYPTVRYLSLLKALRLLPPIYKRFGPGTLHPFYLGYEIGKGFVAGVEHVFKLLPLMPDQAETLKGLRRRLDHERTQVLKALVHLQTEHPEVAVGAKTRHASRAVLNQMRQTLRDLTRDGLIEEGEDEVLVKLLEKKMKKLSGCPATIPSPSPTTTLANLTSWFQNRDDLFNLFAEKGGLVTFVPGEVIYEVGDESKGIYLILSGQVKVSLSPTDKCLREVREWGVVPVSEVVPVSWSGDWTCSDLLSSGSLLGELGWLTGRGRDAGAVSETFVSAYHLSLDLLEEGAALLCNDNHTQHLDSLQARIWTSWAHKLATHLLRQHHRFDRMSCEGIGSYLSRSILPIINPVSLFQIPDFISDLIVVEGVFEDLQSRQTYVAPALLPHSANLLLPKRNPKTVNRILMISHEDVETERDPTLSHTLSPFTHHLGKVEEISRAFSTNNRTHMRERVEGRRRRLSIALTSGRGWTENVVAEDGPDGSRGKGTSPPVLN